MTTVGYGDIVPNTTWGKVFVELLSYFVYVLLSYWGEVCLMSVCDILLNLVVRLLLCFGISGDNSDGFVSWVELLAPMVAPFIFVLIGMFGFHYTANLSLQNSLYLSVVTITGVGFGDVDVLNTAGVVFGSLWMCISTLIYGTCCTCLADRIAARLGVN